MTETVRQTWETANDRFKRSFGRVFWASLIVAAMSHFAFFKFFPTLEANDWRTPEGDIIEVIPPPEIDVPPAPDEIDRPQIPVPSDIEDIEDVIGKTTLDANPPELRPPPPAAAPDPAGGGFAVDIVNPKLKDPARALQTVERLYPSHVKDAGVGGTVVVRARVDTLGRVVDAVIDTSSGLRILDEAALTAVRSFEFTPALNRDRKVEVWVQQKIVFRTR